MSSITRGIASGTALSLAMASTAHAQAYPDYTPSDPALPIAQMAMINMIGFAPLLLVGAVILGSAGASSAAGTEDNSISTAGVMASLTRIAVGYARIVADVSYGTLEADGERGVMVMRDLRLKGLGKYTNCEVTLGKMDLSGLSFWGSEDMRSRIELSDLNIANNCFGPNAAMIGMVTGGNTIPVETLVIDMRQITGSGAASFDIEARSPGIATISGNADFDMFTFSMPTALEELMEESDTYDYQEPTFDQNGSPVYPDADQPPEPGFRGVLRSAHLSVENLGVWERMQPLIPPAMVSPESMQDIVTAEPGSELRAVQEALADTLTQFVEQPGIVTVELRPEQPIAFETAGWESPEDALAVFKPVFTNALPTPPVALIAAPDGGDDPLATGLALADGRGVPQNSRRAIELLSPLEDNAEAMMTVARLSAATDLPGAYAHAQKAAELGASLAPATLDRIEGRLATSDLLAAQPAADTQIPDESFATVPALRNAALAYAEGKGVPRSYVLARRLAGSAAAAGDGQAISLISRLDARFGDDADWIAARDAAADLAMDDWTGMQLASRFAAQ